MSCYNVHVIQATTNPSVAPTDVGQHWINTVSGELWESNGTASVANWILSDIKVKVSSNDTTSGFLKDKIVAGPGVSVVETNDGGNETLTISSIASLNNYTFRYDGHFLNELRHTLADASAGYPVTASPASLTADTTYTNIQVLGFDDNNPEGVGFGCRVPVGATSINFQYTSKPRSVPITPVNVVMEIFSKRFPDNGTPAAFSSGDVLGSLDFSTNLNMRVHTQTATLSSLGITAGDFYLFELARDAAHASDTLVGDWNLVEIALYFS